MTRVAYIVSRFPVATETFIVREINAVERELPVDLYAIVRPERPFVHAAAARWVPRAHQPRPRRVPGALAHWLRRRPLRLARVVGATVQGYWRSPDALAKALVTLAVALDHARAMQADGVTRIHAHFATLPGHAAWVCAELLDVPYSITAHAHDLFMHQHNLRRLVDDADFCVAITRYNHDFLARVGSGRTPLPTVRCGIELERLPYRSRRPPADGPVRLLCVAGFQRQKGHPVLLEALTRPGLERFALRLVGDGPEHDAVRALAARLGVAATFVGTLDEAGVAAELAAADAFVLASVVAPDGQMEGLPVALMEALAAGVPAVSTRLSGIPELNDGAETLLLAEPGDADGLAQALRALLDDPESAAVRAEAGRRLMEDEFTIERSAERLVRLFSGELVAEPRDRG